MMNEEPLKAQAITRLCFYFLIKIKKKTKNDKTRIFRKICRRATRF